MKKLVIIITIGVCLTACNNTSDTQSTTDSSTNTTIQVDTGNRGNSDYGADSTGLHRDTMPHDSAGK